MRKISRYSGELRCLETTQAQRHAHSHCATCLQRRRQHRCTHRTDKHKGKVGHGDRQRTAEAHEGPVLIRFLVCVFEAVYVSSRRRRCHWVMRCMSSGLPRCEAFHVMLEHLGGVLKFLFDVCHTGLRVVWPTTCVADRSAHDRGSVGVLACGIR